MEKAGSVWGAIDREFGNTWTASPAITNESLLKVRTANQCIEDAKSKPIPRMLFAEFWHEGELAVLFADTNIGKSILGVQIGNNVTRNNSSPVFAMTADAQVCLYLDFELSDKQFQQRYSVNFENEYQFSNRFYRVEINPDFSDFNHFEEILKAEIEALILKIQAKVLIVDNLTYLKTQSTDTAKEALPLMKFLKELKNRHDLSILALAHTPKRDNTRPLTVNDLAGSKHLSNFADAIFAIGQSEKGPELRYIKQVKARATEKLYDSDNVIVCRLAKPSNFLGFEFVEYGCEHEHLKARTESQHQEINIEIVTLKESEPNLNNAEIARRLGVNKMKVGRVLDRHSKGTL